MPKHTPERSGGFTRRQILQYAGIGFLASKLPPEASLNRQQQRPAFRTWGQTDIVFAHLTTPFIALD